MTYQVVTPESGKPYLAEVFSASSGETFESKIHYQSVIGQDVAVDLATLESYLSSLLAYIKTATSSISIVSFEDESVTSRAYMGLDGYDEIVETADELSQLWMYVDLNYETLSGGA